MPRSGTTMPRLRGAVPSQSAQTPKAQGPNGPLQVESVIPVSSPSVAATIQPFPSERSDHSSLPPMPGRSQTPSASAVPEKTFSPFSP